MKQIRVLEGNLKVSQDELEAFQVREKSHEIRFCIKKNVQIAERKTEEIKRSG